MSRLFVHGLGAVTPAGWGVPAMRAALERNCPLPVQSLARPGWAEPLRVRLVPPPSGKPGFLAHPRLRRASPMAHYAVGAALEAIGGEAEAIQSGALRLGIVACTMTGGLSYSRRFYEEVLRDPAVASPLLFPETVFNAPASHLAAYLNAETVNYTLVGEPAAFLQGLAVAAQWLEDGVADACVVMGAEEMDWTAGDALRLFDRSAVPATGAGALYVKSSGGAARAELAAVTDALAGVEEARAQLPGGGRNEFHCPGSQAILGEAFVASAAWQCVAACDAVQRCQYEAASVVAGGAGRQAMGARFVKSNFLQS